MRRILSAIVLGFSMAISGFDGALAGPFVHPPIKGDTAAAPVNKPENPAPPPDPKKQLQALPIVTAIEHCLAIDGSITEHFRLVDAFNNQPDLDNLPKDMTAAAKEKTMLYMMGRPDIPDFGFLISDLWRVTKRDQRIKFNSLLTLRLAEALKIKYGAYPFADNCKPQPMEDITKDKTGTEHAIVSMPLAFDVNEVKLTYLLSRQENYNWQIDDLLINNVGVTNYIQKDLAREVKQKGIDEVIRKTCQKSSFSALKC